jgi:hypothetical protein
MKALIVRPTSEDVLALGNQEFMIANPERREPAAVV